MCNYGQVFLQASWLLNKLSGSIGNNKENVKNWIKANSILMQLRGVLILIKAESILRMIMIG
jgi:hypothetical protein